jgi:hypothetical protein
MNIELSAGTRALFNGAGLASLRKIIAAATKVADRLGECVAQNWLVSRDADTPLVKVSAPLQIDDDEDAEPCQVEFYIILSEAPGIRAGAEHGLHLSDGVLSTAIERPFPEC